MKKLTSAEIRQLFLDFFKEKGHEVRQSVSLVPKNDPSLLWINSGVATLKKYFDGSMIPENRRIVNAQKAIRTNDIENVGFTARHHTFFEMLGNFSIGDYFKKEAIYYAWEFLTDKRWLGFDEDLLSVTVHPEDDEAYDIWLNEIKLPEYKIIRLEENFWDIGEGPSGPNTEIFYDRGEAYGNDPDDPELYPGGENERYLEIWNLVFSEFNHNPDNTYTPLPEQNIDTGLGLERLVSVIQDTPTNFETDLFYPIIEEVETISNHKYGKDESTDSAFKIIADHIRTVSFAIGDHALPSNEGRGYILRRLIRRAIRFAKQIGIEKPFMYKLVPTVGIIMGDHYPEVKEQEKHIIKIIKSEEERFHETLNEGLAILSEIIEKERDKGSTVISGEDVFKLYDTYGFPKELTEESVREEGFTIEEIGFEKEMEKQRTRARDAREVTQSMQVQSTLLTELDVESTFVGYEKSETNTKVTCILDDEKQLDRINAGEEAYIMLEETPFYAESGGQVADIGYIKAKQAKAKVIDVQTAPKGQHLHQVQVEKGTIKAGDLVNASFDTDYREGIVKNHTATHLLHQALRDILGDHIQQAGSLVTNDRLRFDFSHFNALTDKELAAIELKVNEKIWENIPLKIETLSFDKAKEMGAMALFDEKYDEYVRVVQVSDYSIELCGGCHVENTAEIGLFKLVSESGIGAGVRRIEALTSKEAYQWMNEKLNTLNEASHLLNKSVDEVPKRINDLYVEIKQLKRENESLQAKLASKEASQILDQVEEVSGIPVLLEKVTANNMEQLRQMVDNLKEELSSGVIMLVTETDGKVQIAAGISKDLVERNLHAGTLINKAANVCGGGGGGRPDMAQAGGTKPEKINEAFETVKKFIENNIES